MSKLPAISGQDAVRVFESIGYQVDHQTGSRIILRHQYSPHRRLTIPNHRELAKGTLRAIIRQAGLSVDRFVELL